MNTTCDYTFIPGRIQETPGIKVLILPLATTFGSFTSFFASTVLAINAAIKPSHRIRRPLANNNHCSTMPSARPTHTFPFPRIPNAIFDESVQLVGLSHSAIDPSPYSHSAYVIREHRVPTDLLVTYSLPFWPHARSLGAIPGRLRKGTLFLPLT